MDLVVHQRQPPGGSGIFYQVYEAKQAQLEAFLPEGRKILPELKQAMQVYGSGENHRRWSHWGCKGPLEASGSNPLWLDLFWSNPLLKQGHQGCLPRTVCIWLLKISHEVVDSTTSLGNLCQWSITHTVKNCFLGVQTEPPVLSSPSWRVPAHSAFPYMRGEATRVAFTNTALLCRFGIRKT